MKTPGIESRILRLAPALAVLAAVGILLGQCGPADAPPNVVIIVMDTVRQDHLSCYGHERPTTPNLDALAEESRLYANAYSTSGWTPPAHASLFTGLYPIAHGTTQERPILQVARHTLAEILAEHGYHTVGISENPMLPEGRGFAQGFAVYHETWKLPEAEENHAVALVRESLDAMDPGRPFHLFVNLIEPHSPYDSSRQFRNRFVTDPGIPHVNNRWPEFVLGEIAFTPAEFEHLRQLYDAEILYADHLVGLIVADLKERGLWEKTVFIVTSDHGENFGDHGLVDHVFSLHESAIRVPLLVRYPPEFAPGSREDLPVQLTDIFPTVLDLAGIGAEAHPSQGVDLRDLDPDRPRVVLSEYYYPRQALGLFTEQQRASEKLAPFKRRMASIVLKDYKYIWGSDGRDELYHVTDDPRETRNLALDPAFDPVRRDLAILLERTVNGYARTADRDTTDAGQEMDEATRKALRSLGYIR